MTSLWGQGVPDRLSSLEGGPGLRVLWTTGLIELIDLLIDLLHHRVLKRGFALAHSQVQKTVSQHPTVPCRASPLHCFHRSVCLQKLGGGLTWHGWMPWNYLAFYTRIAMPPLHLEQLGSLKIGKWTKRYDALEHVALVKKYFQKCESPDQGHIFILFNP